MSELSRIAALKLDKITVSLEDLLWRMKMSGDLRDIIEDTAREVLLEHEARSRGLKATKEEIAEGVEDIYQTFALEDSREATDILKDEGLTMRDLEKAIENSILIDKAREALTDAAIDPYFKKHWEEYEVVSLSPVICRDKSLALEQLQSLRHGKISFEDLLRSCGSETRAGVPATLAGEQVRADLPQSLREPIFAARIGDVVGPLEYDGAAYLFRIDGLSRAELDEELRGEIMDVLVQEWVETRLDEMGMTSDLLPMK
jgi:hypothetical protein